MASTDAAAALQSTGAVSPVQKKKRLAGRNTRVELQAIPKQEKKAGKKTVPLAQRTEGGQVVVESAAPIKEVVTEAPSVVKVRQRSAPAREKLAGSGKVLKGHAEVTVENSHVTAASVVLVSLLSNPGKIVVHYYTLLPGYGFTVHLSDEVMADTPFNYVILLGELL
jgi:cystathionine beta-lyase/cystathionine gamma-synthase